jgi:hypothetical protein
MALERKEILSRAGREIDGIGLIADIFSWRALAQNNHHARLAGHGNKLQLPVDHLYCSRNVRGEPSRLVRPKTDSARTAR